MLIFQQSFINQLILTVSRINVEAFEIIAQFSHLGHKIGTKEDILLPNLNVFWKKYNIHNNFTWQSQTIEANEINQTEINTSSQLINDNNQSNEEFSQNPLLLPEQKLEEIIIEPQKELEEIKETKESEDQPLQQIEENKHESYHEQSDNKPEQQLDQLEQEQEQEESQSEQQTKEQITEEQLLPHQLSQQVKADILEIPQIRVEEKERMTMDSEKETVTVYQIRSSGKSTKYKESKNNLVENNQGVSVISFGRSSKIFPKNKTLNSSTNETRDEQTIQQVNLTQYTVFSNGKSTKGIKKQSKVMIYQNEEKAMTFGHSTKNKEKKFPVILNLNEETKIFSYGKTTKTLKHSVKIYKFSLADNLISLVDESNSLIKNISETEIPIATPNQALISLKSEENNEQLEQGEEVQRGNKIKELQTPEETQSQLGFDQIDSLENEDISKVEYEQNKQNDIVNSLVQTDAMTTDETGYLTSTKINEQQPKNFENEENYEITSKNEVQNDNLMDESIIETEGNGKLVENEVEPSIQESNIESNLLIETKSNSDHANDILNQIQMNDVVFEETNKNDIQLISNNSENNDSFVQTENVISTENQSNETSSIQNNLSEQDTNKFPFKPLFYQSKNYTCICRAKSHPYYQAEAFTKTSFMIYQKIPLIIDEIDIIFSPLNQNQTFVFELTEGNYLNIYSRQIGKYLDYSDSNQLHFVDNPTNCGQFNILPALDLKIPEAFRIQFGCDKKIFLTNSNLKENGDIFYLMDEEWDLINSHAKFMFFVLPKEKFQFLLFVQMFCFRIEVENDNDNENDSNEQQ